MSSGLLRYWSAPSSLLGEVCDDFLPSCPETETMFARLLAPDLRNESSSGGATAGQSSPRFPPPPPSSAQEVNEQQQMIIHSQQQQQMPNRSLVESSFPAAVGSSAMGFGSPSNLTRHSSSPAALFPHLNVDDGCGMMKGMNGFRNGSGLLMDATSRSKARISFFSRQKSVMSQISEIGSEDMDESSPKDGGGGGRSYIPGFPVASTPFCEEASLNCFPVLTGGENGEVRNHASGLLDQTSLPKSSSEMAAIKKFLQFHDAVPCKIRAKRGCATHPRSIAERVRRTRISERMKKLQELVPNMDKQTNTADMLDLAVEYIKDLQKQVQALSESRAKCSCSASMQKTY